MNTVDFLRRHIERNEWADTTQSPGYSACPVKAEYASDSERYEAWLTESLLTGLTSPDRLIAYRCSLQAAAYRGRLSNRGGAGLSDAFLELRNRIESFLKEGA
jgi:hypothetical protein